MVRCEGLTRVFPPKETSCPPDRPVHCAGQGKEGKYILLLFLNKYKFIEADVPQEVSPTR